MGFLTTHVLDTASGEPAQGLKIEVLRISKGAATLLGEFVTNSDGRVDRHLLSDKNFQLGTYELRFYAGDYLRAHHANLPDPLFLDLVPVRFGIADESAHYHVPLLISPFGYSTYRGS